MAKVMCKYPGCGALISYMDKVDKPPDYCHLHKHIAAYEAAMARRSGQAPKIFSQVFDETPVVNQNKVNFSEQMFSQKKEPEPEEKTEPDEKTITEAVKPEPVKMDFKKRTKKNKWN